MDTSIGFATLLIAIPILIALLLLGLLITALFLRLAVRFQEKFELPWGEAILTAFLAWLAGFVVGLPYGIAMELLNMNQAFAFITGIIIGIVARGWVYGVRIAPPGDLPIGMGRGIRVALMVFAMMFLFTMVIVIGILMVMFALGSTDLLNNL